MFTTLEHMSEEELAILIKRYYSKEPVSAILKEFNLDIRPSNLYKHFPPEQFKETCKYCGEHLIRNRVSKTYLDKLNSRIYCPTCNHKPYMTCYCHNCQLEAQREREKFEQKVHDFYSIKYTPVEFSSLNFEDRIYLGTLCRALSTEDFYEIAPLSGSDVVLAPTSDIIDEIYSHLIEKKVIVVSPKSAIDAFDLEAVDFPQTFNKHKVTYVLNLNLSPSKSKLLNSIISPQLSIDEYEGPILTMWKKIAIAECIEYLLYQLKSVKFIFTPGEKTYKTFELLLENFSISQIYGFIKKAVANASKWYLESSVSRRHAANASINECLRLGELAKINNWQPYNYRRIPDLPQSTLSQFFFNQVMKIGDQGFTSPVPHLNVNQN